MGRDLYGEYPCLNLLTFTYIRLLPLSVLFSPPSISSLALSLVSLSSLVSSLTLGSHAYQWNTPNTPNPKSSKLPGQSSRSSTVNTQMWRSLRKHVTCSCRDRRKMGGGNRRIQRGFLIRIALLIILVRLNLFSSLFLLSHFLAVHSSCSLLKPVFLSSSSTSSSDTYRG